MNLQKHEKEQLAAFAARVADRLGERKAKPRSKIRRIVYVIGPRRALAFAQHALDIEASGGMWLPDGSRKRTLGGIFFRLVRDHVSETERDAIWPPRPVPQPRQPVGISTFWQNLAAGKPATKSRKRQPVAM